MHTIKQHLAEADIQINRIDTTLADVARKAQTLIEDVPEFMATLRRSMENLITLTHEVERLYVDEVTGFQAQVVNGRALLQDPGPIAQPTEESPEQKSAVPLGLAKAA